LEERTMKDFVHYSARSVDEAVDLLEKRKGRAKLNAGGTDLLGVLKDRLTPDYPEAIINIKGIKGLDYVEEDGDGLRIGALTKLAKVVESPIVKEKYRVIAEAAKSVATPQIRNMCTIGGNIAQDVRCWYYRYPDELGGTVMCLRKGGAVCNALVGDNRYHSIFGTAPLASYPCATSCPAGTAIPSYLAKVRNGEFDEAARIFINFSPMPAITGRVCPTFCEPECKRGGYDEPVAVRCVERSLGDYMLDRAEKVYKAPGKESGKTVAIIGSGPAGLAAAYYLRSAGHGVTVYEKLPEAGGMLLYSIPGYRLPKDVVRRQVKALEGMGILFEVGTEVEKDVTIEDLKGRFDAVLFATGAWKEKDRAIKGNAPILSGLQFLKDVNEGDQTIPGKKVAVVGGGNVAIDVARTLLRLGAKPVVFYRRTVKEVPAFRDEIERAREEGVAFRFLTLPTSASKSAGRIALGCVKMKLGPVDDSGRPSVLQRDGSEFTIAVDAVITATGEEPDLSLLPSAMRKKAGKGHSKYPVGLNVYGAGDFMNGSSTVIEAIASGREAARTIGEDFGAKGVTNDKATTIPAFISAAYEPAPRLSVQDAPVSERLRDPSREDRPGVTAAEAQKEAGRCFNCGCVAVSPSDIGVALVAAGGKIVTTKRSIEASVFFAPDATTSTVLDADEMITEIRVPKIADGARQEYLKFTLRKPIDFAIVGVAAVISTRNGKCTDARLALGAVGPAPFRASAAEKSLTGKALTEEAAEAAAKAAVEGALPLSKNGYKVQVTRALVKRAILGERA
jgi:NADPH-dependent glutamate synthase beta subunit-like oxidoreductase/CO/xanthine dehydrogenase FAD-binding subunit